METKRSSIQPTASKIVVYELYPLITGQPVIVLDNVRRIVKHAHNQANVVIGYVSRAWAQPRFKDYEEHKGLEVKSVTIIYQTGAVKDVTKMEAELIKSLKNHCNNKNVRNEEVRDKTSPDSIYYIYLASDKRLDFNNL